MVRPVKALGSLFVVALCALQVSAADAGVARSPVIPGKPADGQTPEPAPPTPRRLPSSADAGCEVLFEMLESPSPSVRARALEGLVCFTSPETAQACIELLADEDEGVRQAARQTLLALNAEDTVHAILRALCGEDEEAQSALDAVLPMLRDSLQEAMMGVLDGAEEALVRRAAAAYALGRMGSTEAVDVLSHYAWQEPVELAIFSAAALARIGGPDTEVILVGLCEHPVPEIQVQAVHGLAEIGGPRGLSVLTGLLVDSEVNGGVRAEAAFLLGRVGADIPAMVESVLSALIQGLRASGEVRAESGDALRRLTGLDLDDHPTPWQEWFRDWQSDRARAAVPPPLVPHAPSRRESPGQEGDADGARVLFRPKRGSGNGANEVPVLIPGRTVRETSPSAE